MVLLLEMRTRYLIYSSFIGIIYHICFCNTGRGNSSAPRDFFRVETFVLIYLESLHHRGLSQFYTVGGIYLSTARSKKSIVDSIES